MPVRVWMPDCATFAMPKSSTFTPAVVADEHVVRAHVAVDDPEQGAVAVDSRVRVLQPFEDAA